MGESGDISPLLFPNQALYQAEPQPEMDWFPGCLGRRASYFAYFGADSKELALDRLPPTEMVFDGSAAAEKASDRTLLESSLCYYGRNSLTKRRFA